MWAGREQVQLDCSLPEKLLHAVFVRDDSSEKFYLQGRFDGYKALPPIWEWCDANCSNAGDRRLSRDSDAAHELIVMPFEFRALARRTAFYRRSVCAPFNRLAYIRPRWSRTTELGRADSLDDCWSRDVSVRLESSESATCCDTIARDFRYQLSDARTVA